MNAETHLDFPQLQEGEGLIVLVGTNDIHGNFLATSSLDKQLGGFDVFSGYLKNIKKNLEKNYKQKYALLILDAGDSFQGTLLSNFSEGQLGVVLMNELGYTASLLGNHGFDFGPLGWEQDKCVQNIPCDSLEAIKAMTDMSRFPFLGTNVFEKIPGKRPDFLKEFTLVNAFGRNIAILGMENPLNNRLTIPENVANLEFTDGIKEIQETVEDLFQSSRADIFILLAHNGDDNNKKNMGEFLKRLPKRSDGAPLIQAVIAGHTHRHNQNIINGIPYIQSGAGGKYFGIISLVIKTDSQSGQLNLLSQKTQFKASIPIEYPGNFLSEKVIQDENISSILNKSKENLNRVAKERIGKTTGELTYKEGRTQDSLVGNWIADVMKSRTQSDLALINSGDIRDSLPKGEILFEDLFNVIPKNLQLVKVFNVPTQLVLESLERSIRSCGIRGALQVSGLKLFFRRNCTNHEGDEDKDARIVRIKNDKGDVIYEKGKILINSLTIATTDFVLAGGAGYSSFVGKKFKKEYFVLRDQLINDLKIKMILNKDDYLPNRYHNCLKIPLADCD